MRNVHLPTAKTKRRSILFFEIGMIIALSFILWAFNISHSASYNLPEPPAGSAIDETVEDIGKIFIEPDLALASETKRVNTEAFDIVRDDTPIPEPSPDPSPDPKPDPNPFEGTIQVKAVPDPDPASLIEEPKDWVSQMPQFPGGEVAMTAFITRNVNYPPLAIENEIQGRVMVSFVVEKDGSLSNVKIERSVGWGIDDEAIRVVKSMPNWLPGENNYRPVRVRIHLPIKFMFKD